MYDALYAEKDYAGECDFIEEALRFSTGARVETLLDLGCGTGGHAVLLAQRGYTVTGSDLSEPMLERAREKAQSAGVHLELVPGDLREVDAGGPFDAVLMMFAVIGYQRSNSDVEQALDNVRRHLRPGGLFVFDAWYGPGVLTDPPGSRERTVPWEGTKVHRSVTSELDSRRHLCSVHYDLSGAANTRETHVMRFFFPLELEGFLRRAGFELVSLAPVGRLQGEPTTADWNVSVVARAV